MRVLVMGTGSQSRVWSGPSLCNRSAFNKLIPAFAPNDRVEWAAMYVVTDELVEFENNRLKFKTLGKPPMVLDNIPQTKP